MKRKFYLKFFFTLFLVIIVFINIFSSSLINGYLVTYEKNNIFFLYEKSYIIRFKKDSLSCYRNKLENSIINSLSRENLKNFINEKVMNYKKDLLIFHSQVEKDILKIVGDAVKPQQIFFRNFTSLFNGMVIKNISPDIISLIQNLPYVESISPNRKIKIFLDNSIPLINANDTWQLHDKLGNNLKGNDVNIAIVDTGIDYNHPAIKNNYVGGYDFINNDADPMDDNGHGTLCAGIAAGVAPNVNLYSFKILDEKGEGNESGLYAAIDYALDPNNDGDYSDRFIDIFSMSFGDSNTNNYTPDDPLCKEIDDATNIGLLFVIAAGNSGPGNKTINWPGITNRSICVGASDNNEHIADFSSRGPIEWNDSIMIKPDVVAPGVDIRSTYLDGWYVTKSGTSMATPHVAGAAALILQAHHDWTPEMIKNTLKETAVDLGYDENTQGAGRIDVLAAVNLSKAPPIAILNITKYLSKNIITIYGTARNGTGNSNDFINYSLYYKFEHEWIKLTENNSEINTSILYTWNTINLKSGTYTLKLVVNSIDQASIAIKEVNIGHTGLILEYPETIFEKEKFNIKIFNSDFKPVSALVIFISQSSIPRIKYGSDIWIRAPTINNPFFQNLTGKLIILKIQGLQKNIVTITINKKNQVF